MAILTVVFLSTLSVAVSRNKAAFSAAALKPGGNPNAVLLAEGAILPDAVDPVAMDRFRIMPEALPIGFDLSDQIIRFVVRIPVESIKEDRPLVRRAGRQLGANLRRRRRFAPHNGTHMGLAEADDPPGNPVAAVLIQPVLLTIQLLNHQQVAVPATRKPSQGHLQQLFCRASFFFQSKTNRMARGVAMSFFTGVVEPFGNDF